MYCLEYRGYYGNIATQYSALNEDKDAIAELYLVDDETVIIDPDLMEGLSEDLDDFFKKLFED